MLTENNRNTPNNFASPIIEANGRFLSIDTDRLTAVNSTAEVPAQLLAESERSNQLELHRLEKTVRKLEKKVPAERRAELLALSESIQTQTTTTELCQAILSSCEHQPEFKAVAQFCRELQTVLQEATTTLKTNEHGHELSKVIADLLQRKTIAQDNQVISITTIIGSEKTTELSLLSKSITKKSNRAIHNAEILQTILTDTLRKLQNPTTLVGILLTTQIDAETPVQNKDSLESLQAALEPIETYIHIISVLDAVTAAKLPTNESSYLRALVCQNLAVHSECPVVWAADLAAGKDIFTTTDIDTVIDALLSPYEEVNKAATSKQLRQLNRVLVTLLLGAHLLSSQEALIQVGSAIVDTTAQIAQSIHHFATEPNTTEVQPLETPTPEILRPETNPEITATPKPKIERALPKPITEDELSWSSTTTQNNGISSSAATSPEQMRQQQTKIAWQILKQPDDAQYFLQRILPMYSPETSEFSPFQAATNEVYSYEVPINSHNSELVITAKRTSMDMTTFIPRPWGYQIDAARVQFKIGSMDTRVEVSVGMTADNTAVLLIDPEDLILLNTAKEIELFIGFSKMDNTHFDPEVIHYDADTTIIDETVLPPELQDLIHSLNASSASDVERLQELKAWFLQNFTYSVNPTVNNYYAAGYPSTEQQLRRVFGTGTSESDPGYKTDLELQMKGICSSVNTLYAATARLLNLKDGQVLTAAGYLNLPFTQKNKTLLTEGAYHAWSIYITNAGEMTVLDATPSRLEDYTSEVFRSLNETEEFTSETIRELESASEVSANYPYLYELPQFTYTLDSIVETYPNQVEKPGNWQVKSVQGEPKTAVIPDQPGLFPMATHLINGRWTIDPYFFPLDKQYDLQRKVPFRENDIVMEVSSTRRLNHEALWLPNNGVISPASIEVFRIPDSDPSIKIPVPIKELLGSTRTNFDMDLNEYALVLAASENELKTSTFEIRYLTGYGGLEIDGGISDGVINLPSDETAELFHPQVDRTVFDPKLQELLQLLDREFTLYEVIDGNYLDTIFNVMDVKLLDPDTIIEKSSTNVRAMLVSAYIRENYEITLSPRWRELYLTGNPTTSEYIERIQTHRKIDPQSYVDLLGAILSTIKIEGKNYTLPFIVRYVPATNLVEKMAGISLDFANDTYDSELSYSELNKIPQIEMTTPYETDTSTYFLPYTGPMTQYNFLQLVSMYESEYSAEGNMFTQEMVNAAYQPPYDPITQEKVGQVIGQLLDAYATQTAGSENVVHDELVARKQLEYITEFISPSLDSSELQQAIITEYFQVEFYKWLYVRGKAGILIELGIAALVGFLLGDWVRRRTSWMRGFRAEMVDEILSEAVERFGEEAINSTIYQDLREFLIDVMQPYKCEVFPFKGISKAVRMQRFAYSQRTFGKKFFEGSNTLDKVDAATIRKHLPIVGKYHIKYADNFRKSVLGHPASAYIAKRSLHELFKQGFAFTESKYFIQYRFQDEVSSLLAVRGWIINNPLQSLLSDLLTIQSSFDLELTPQVLADPEVRADVIEKLVNNIVRHLHFRITKYLKENNLPSNIDIEDRKYLIEISTVIAEELLVPYVERLHAEQDSLAQ